MRRFYAGMKGANKQLCNEVSTKFCPLLICCLLSCTLYPVKLLSREHLCWQSINNKMYSNKTEHFIAANKKVLCFYEGRDQTIVQ